MTKIKICGITNLEDALMAVDLGVDALGFIFSPKSERKIAADRAEQIISKLPPYLTTVGVFVNQSAEEIKRAEKKCRFDVIQLHGTESPTFAQTFQKKIIKAIHVKSKSDLFKITEYKVSAFILDTKVKGMFGGTGKTFDWELAVEAKQFGPLILSGGLTPDNVAEAVKKVKPYAVDVATGVELSPGFKDPVGLAKFVEEVRRCQ